MTWPDSMVFTMKAWFGRVILTMCIRTTEGRDVRMASQEVDMSTVLFRGSGDPPGGGGGRQDTGRRQGVFGRAAGAVGGAARRLAARFRR